MAGDLFDVSTQPSVGFSASARFILENTLDYITTVDPA